MRIALCGSIAFYDEMLNAKKKLERMGHSVELPPLEIPDGEGNRISVKEYYRIRKESSEDERWVWERKKEAILEHFRKIRDCDAVLVLNYEKNGIKGYVGANTLMEMGLALFLGKRIFLLNSVPEMQYREEILGVNPIVLDGKLEKIC